jgi:hypothetical protein
MLGHLIRQHPFEALLPPASAFVSTSCKLLLSEKAKQHCCFFCLQVLPSFLDHADLLQARLVCHEWRTAFRRNTKQLQLVQPMSAGTAWTLARKAAAAFPCASTLRIMLFHTDIETVTFDMTGDDETPVCTSAKLDRPDAATALLRQYTGKFSGIGSMLLLVPQLRVLDLGECPHKSADLLVVARHLQHLQQLLLHCPYFTTLAGCRKSSGDASWAPWAAAHRTSRPMLRRWCS